MSWFSTNYEKALLGGAAVIAIGFAYAGWSKLGSIDELFQNPLRGEGAGTSSAVAQAEAVPKAMQSLELDRAWEQGKTPDGRAVDVFTGIALFLKREGSNRPLDIEKGTSVHAGIPNEWWLENRLDPGFADSPERDPDEDGFTNREEFLAQTDPNDKGSHPPLISKLQFVRDESMKWVLRPSFMGANGDFPFEYNDGQGLKNKAGAGTMIKPDQIFFDEEPAKGRFKLLGHVVRKEKNEATSIEMEVTYARVQDLKPNKDGKIYEIPAPLSKSKIKHYIQHDRSAVLSLNALGMEGDEWSVEENTSFSLPKDGPAKTFLLKEVTPEAVVVEYLLEDGTKQSIRIPKRD